jgi:phosphoglycerate dehydrogenase-like enzyme
LLRLEGAVPRGCTVHWPQASDQRALVDADVSVGGCFTAPMAAAAEKLRLVHAAGAGTDGIAFDASSSEMLVANTFHHEQSIAAYVLAAAVPPPTA